MVDHHVTSAGARRRGGLRRFLVVLIVIIALLVVGAALLGPKIAATFAPVVARNAAGDAIRGEIALGSVNLSWRGPQRIGPIELRDEAGAVALRADVEATTSLLSVLFGSRDLGVITLRGKADLEGDGKGGLTILRDRGAGAGPRGSDTASAKERTALPRGLKARIVLDGVDVSYRDPTTQSRHGGPIGLVGLNGSIDFGVNQPVIASLKGMTLDKSGSVGVELKADRITNASGVLTPAEATAEGSLKAALPSGYVDTLAGAGGLIGDIAKGIVTLTCDFAGDVQSGAVEIHATASETKDLRADARLTFRDGHLRIDEPAVLVSPITQAALDRIAGKPGLIAIDRPAIITARIDALDVPLLANRAAGSSSTGLDLRGAAVKARIESEEIAGALSLTPGEQPDAFRIAPAVLTLDAPDLAGPVRLTAASSATYRGQSAGELMVDLQAQGLLDDRGAPRRAGLPALRGTATVKGAATALAQPFVDRLGLDLPRDIGPTLDASLVAASAASSALGPDSVAPTDLTVTVHAQRLSGRAEVSLDDKRFRTRGDGITMRLSAAGAALSRVLADKGVRISGDGALSLAATGLDIPRTARGIRLDQAAASIEAEAEGLTIWPAPDAASIEASALHATITLVPGAAPKVRLEAELASGGRPFDAQADFSLEGLFASDGSVDVAGVRPRGDARIAGAPTAIVTPFLPSADDAELLRRAAGESVDAVISAKPSTESGATRIDVELKGVNAAAHAAVDWTPRAKAAVSAAGASASLSPELIEAALRRFAPDLAPAPRLAAPVRADLTVADFVLPLGPDGKPDLARAQPIDAALTVADDIILNGVEAAGRSVNVGVRGLRARVNAGMAESAPRQASASGLVFDPSSPQQPVASLNAEAGLTAGKVTLVARADGIDARRLDAMLGRPDLTELALGSPAAITMKVDRRSAGEPMLIDAGVVSPRLKTAVKAQVAPDHVALTAPADITWTMEERWAAQYLLPASAEGQRPPMRVVGPTTVNIAIRKAAIGLGSAPLKHGVFALDARAGIPRLMLESRDGVAVQYRDVVVEAASTEQPGAVTLNASMTGDEAASFRMTGAIADLADGAGVLTTDRASVSLKAQGSLPAGLIDSLAGGRGRIAEMLGDQVRIDAEADRLSRRGGSLRATAVSPRASAVVTGEVRDNAFYATGPTRAELSVITPALGELALRHVFPMIGWVEKRPEDGPAVIEVANLIAPTDGDISKLSGAATISLGKLHYRAAEFFGEILEATNNRSESDLFAEWSPIQLSIDKGVATYERFLMPIGKFTLENRGAVDLVQQHAEIITYVPFRALGSKVARAVEKVPGLTGETAIPIRTRGRFGALKSEPALDLLVTETLKDPTSLIEDVLKQIGKDRKKDEKRP